MNVKKIGLGAMTLMIMVSCGNKTSNPFGGGDNTPQEYPTEVLSMQATELETVYPVTIKGQEDVEIRPRIDGFIDAVYVDEGATVRKGQVLFKINSPSAEQALRTAQASLESAKAQVNTAQLNVDRFKPLAEQGIVSQVQLDTYQNTLLTTKATLAQAQAQLVNAQAQMSWTNVSSPVDGVVGTINYRQGSLVNNSNALTTVSSTGNVFAYFSINEKELMSLLTDLPGKTQAEKINNLPPVTLKMADGTIYPEKGKIKTISGSVSIATGSANFRAEFPNPHGVLRSGFSGNLSIPKHLDEAIIVPQGATFSRQNKHLIYKVVNDTLAIQTLIDVVSTPDGKSYVVTDGLSAGDRIITNGVATLSDSARIVVKK